MARKRSPVDVDQLRSWNLITAFRARVLPALEQSPLQASEGDPRRNLHALDYFCALLLAMFNPLIGSLRALAAVSHSKKMRQVTAAPFAASSFSEGQHLFAPKILSRTVRQLVQEVQAKGLGHLDGGRRHDLAGRQSHGLGFGGWPRPSRAFASAILGF